MIRQRNSLLFDGLTPAGAGGGSGGDPRIEVAFATVPREDFLGTGPWLIPRWLIGRVHTPTPDRLPYSTRRCKSFLSGISTMACRGRMQSGSPLQDPRRASTSCTLTAPVTIPPFLRIWGPAGSVTGIEIIRGLPLAASKLGSHPNVRVIHGDGVLTPFDAADIVYVSAGATRPPDVWLDGLSEGGRLVLPLRETTGSSARIPTPHLIGSGQCFFSASDPDVLAQWISPDAFIRCANARDLQSEVALAEAFERGMG